jgi:hypothetical protein
MMMIAMQCINKFCCAGCFGHPVKNITMRYIFKERPEEHAAKENQQDGAGAEIIFGGSRVNNKSHDGDIHTPDDQRIGLGQCLQEIAFEQTGLAFIMNFFEMHGAKIRKGMWGENGAMA